MKYNQKLPAKVEKNPLSTLLKEREEAFVEQGANLEHDRWTRWQKYMFSKGTVDADGIFHLPKEFVDRWFRQIDTKYADLSEPEKESDRKEARQYLPIHRETFRKTLEAVREMCEMKAPIKLMQDGVSMDYSFREGFNKALSDLSAQIGEVLESTSN